MVLQTCPRILWDRLSLWTFSIILFLGSTFSMIIVTSRETGPRTEYIPLRQYYHRCNLDRGPDITGGLKLGKTSICFLVFFPKYCSKALSVNILGDPRHHPLWQQCCLPISLWMVGTTKGEMIPLHWIQHFLLIPVSLAGSTQGKTFSFWCSGFHLVPFF